MLTVGNGLRSMGNVDDDRLLLLEEENDDKDLDYWKFEGDSESESDTDTKSSTLAIRLLSIGTASTGTFSLIEIETLELQPIWPVGWSNFKKFVKGWKTESVFHPVTNVFLNFLKLLHPTGHVVCNSNVE